MQRIVVCASRCKQHLEQGDAGLRALAAGQLLSLAAPYYPHLRPQVRPALLDLAAALISAQAQARVPLRAARSSGCCRRKTKPARTAQPSSHALAVQLSRSATPACLVLVWCSHDGAQTVPHITGRSPGLPPDPRAPNTSSALPGVLAATLCRAPLGRMRRACKRTLRHAHRPVGRASERPRRAGRRGAVLRAAAPRALGLRGARQRVAGGAAGGGAGAGGAVARARARARAVRRLHAAAVRLGARARRRQGSSVPECHTCSAVRCCRVHACLCWSRPARRRLSRCA
jgi:hypothetical protein